MIAHDIMTARPTVVFRNEPIRRAAQLMAQLDVGALPVVDDEKNGRLVGIITDRDIVLRHVAMGGSADCCIGDHMTARDLRMVHPDTDVQDVIGRMSRDQIRRVPVVDDDHRVIGIIAQADIARRLGSRSPNVVGEVLEEISTPHTLQMQPHRR